MPVLVISLLCEKTPWPKATWWRSLLWLMVPTGEWSIIEGSMVTSNRCDGRTKKLRTQRNRTQREWTRRGRGNNHPSPSDNHPPTRLHHLNLPQTAPPMGEPSIEMPKTMEDNSYSNNHSAQRMSSTKFHPLCSTFFLLHFPYFLSLKKMR